MSDLDVKLDLITRKCKFYFEETSALIKKLYYAWRGFDKSSFESKMVPKKFECFPFPKAYSGQNEAIEQLITENGKMITLRSPTGTGKTAVFLTALREIMRSGRRVIAIEPRKDLQDQIVMEYSPHYSKFGMPIYDLKRREEYCNKRITDEKNRQIAACRRRYRRRVKTEYIWYFRYKGEEIVYPCRGCPYRDYKERIFTEYLNRQALLLPNPGNFYVMYHKFHDEELYPDAVVIDEADVFLRMITKAVTLKKAWLDLAIKHSNELPEESVEVIGKVVNQGKLSRRELLILLQAIDTAIQLEIESIKERLTVDEDQKPTEEDLKMFEKLNEKRDELNSAHRRILKFIAFPEKVFYYYKNDQIVVEVYMTMEELVEKIFGSVEKCIIVSATAPVCDSKIVSYDVEFPFSKVIFLPIEKLTFSNVFTKNNDSERAFEILNAIFAHLIFPLGKEVSMLFGVNPMLPIPIFCGSMKFVDVMSEVFEKNGIDKYLIHHEGNLKDIVKEFYTGKYYVAAFGAGAEYGGNWYMFPYQCILRMPYRDKENPREQALYEYLGKEKWEWDYTWDAMSRFIQACGRNARNPLSFAITITPDIKVFEVYEEMKRKKPKLIPSWFRNRVLIPVIDNNGKLGWYDDYGRPFVI